MENTSTIQCHTCHKGHFVPMRKKTFEQYGIIWKEHKCSREGCGGRKYVADSYSKEK